MRILSYSLCVAPGASHLAESMAPFDTFTQERMWLTPNSSTLRRVFLTWLLELSGLHPEEASHLEQSPNFSFSVPDVVLHYSNDMLHF